MLKYILMFYSLFTYAGLTLVILSGARVLDPFFEGLGKNGEMIQLAVEVACFVIGAELLLKPAFEDQKEIGTKKNITPRGSGDSFSAKANKKESTKKTKKNNNQIKRSYSTGNKKYRKKYDDDCNNTICFNEVEVFEPVIKWSISFTSEEDDQWPYTKHSSKKFLWSIFADE